MLNNNHLAGICVVFCALFLARCSLVDERDRKGSNTGLVVTPVASYSTLKARNLAQKYNDNLERFVVEVVRNPTTGRLQFANNIASTGGIGFFTHSASKAVDERYLELILAVPEVFDEGAGLDSKIDRLLSQYGAELLGILLRDSTIYGDPEVAGYGLNFFWRSMLQGQAGSQIVFERAVLYFKKDEARKFLDHKLTKDALLSEAVIFAMRGEGPAQQVAYASREVVSASNTQGQEEKPQETAIAALKAEVTEKDISTEKENRISEKEQKAGSKPTAAKNAEIARVPKSDGPKKEAEVPALPPKKPAQETSGKPTTVIAKEKADRPPTEAVVRELPTVRSGSKDSASARVPGGTEPQSAQTAPERAKELSEKTDSPLKVEESQPVERRVSHDLQRAVPSPESKQATEKEKQDQVEKPVSTVPKIETPTKNQPVMVTGEAKAQEGKEVKDKSVQIQPAQAAEPLEQTANKVAPQKTESFQEATLRKNLPQEVTRQTTMDAAPGRGDTPKSAETSATKEAGKRTGEGTTEVAGPGPSTTKIQPDKPAANEKAPATASQVRVALKSVEGYVVQVSFPQKTDAQRWSETLSREGYTTSITSIGEADSVRLRVGSFSSPEAAKNLLGRLQKQGLNGFVIQVPKG